MSAEPNARKSPVAVASILDDPAMRPSLLMVADRAFTEHERPSRDDLVWAAMSVWAPSPVIDVLLLLPDRTYSDADEVWNTVRVNGARALPPEVGHQRAPRQDLHRNH